MTQVAEVMKNGAPDGHFERIALALLEHRGLTAEGGESLRPGVRQVVAELAPVFDEADIAAWLAEPNAWLGGRAPLATMSTDTANVLRAARADRFVAAG
jgi:hypothetical protein